LVLCFANLTEESHTHWIVFIKNGKILRNLANLKFDEVKSCQEKSK